VEPSDAFLPTPRRLLRFWQELNGTRIADGHL
jgi:hypothetical protein